MRFLVLETKSDIQAQKNLLENIEESHLRRPSLDRGIKSLWTLMQCYK